MTTKINMLAIDLAKGSFQVAPLDRRGRLYTTEVCPGHGWRRFLPSSQRVSWQWGPVPRRTTGAEFHNGTATRFGLSRRPT